MSARKSSTPRSRARPHAKAAPALPPNGWDAPLHELERDSLSVFLYLALMPEETVELVRDLGLTLPGFVERSQVIAAPRVTIREKIDLIAKMMKDVQRASFRSLLNQDASRLEVVVTFLAMLELVKRYRIIAHQEGLFGEIEIDRMEDWNDDEEIEVEFE